MTAIKCRCGSVTLTTSGPPMMTVVCHCTSCRTAGRALDAGSSASPIVDLAGGTAVVVWRKDRVRCIRGGKLLVAHRLTPDSPSRRMVASCCATPMFGDFTKGFWVSVYRGRAADAPRPTMRVMTRDVPVDVVIPEDGLPRFRNRPVTFLFKLLTNWVAIGFRNPPLAGVSD